MGGDALCFVALVLDSTHSSCVSRSSHLASLSTDHARVLCVAERVDVYNPDTVVIEKGDGESRHMAVHRHHDFDDPDHPLVTSPIRLAREPGGRARLWGLEFKVPAVALAHGW